MNHMKLCNPVKQMFAYPVKVAIDRCCSDFQKCSGFIFVLRHCSMCMVQVGDTHNPMIDSHIRLEVEEKKGFLANS